MSEWLDNDESLALLRGMFPCGLGGADVATERCPDGWCRSDLRLAFHPTPEQQWQEALAWQANWRRLRDGARARMKSEERRGDRSASPEEPPPLPEREEFMRQAEAAGDKQVDSDDVELGRLVGLCLWDILANNHDLLGSDGRVCHIGSFRSTAGVIAGFFYAYSSSGEQQDKCDEASAGDDRDAWDMGYLEFYMGTIWVASRTDLLPVYRCIFRRLKACGYDWQYAFPRLGMVRLSRPEPADEHPEWHGYDPSAAFAREQEEREKAEEMARLQESLDELHNEALEHAKGQPPPAVVRAYRAVYGGNPPGWPPWEHE